MKWPKQVFSKLGASFFALILLIQSKSFGVEATNVSNESLVHVKVRFIEVADFSKVPTQFLYPAPETNVFLFRREDDFQQFLRAILTTSGAESFGEPETVVTNGQKSILLTTFIATVRNINPKALSFPGVETTNDIFEHSWLTMDRDYAMKSGAAIYMTPKIMRDTHILKLNAHLDILEKLWETNSHEVFVHGEKQNVAYADVVWRCQKDPIDFTGIKLYDHQSILFRGLNLKGLNSPKRPLLVLVTVNIVDSAGNRVHDEDEMSFATNSIPAQP
jgi:hypothetical protein